jgi:hypothetical protein
MTKAAKTGTELAEVKPSAIIAAPDFLGAEDFNAGFEGSDKDSYAIPFIQILQKMSPLVDEDSPKRIEGAKAGMLYNNVTGQLYDVRDTPLVFVQAAYKRSFILWGARDADGGFKGEVTPERMDEIVASGAVENVDGKLLVKDEKGEVNPKKSDYYADTRSHYVIVLDPKTGETMPAIISLASTQIKPSKALMTSLQNKKVNAGGVLRTPPTFANLIKFTTSAQQNAKGSWALAKFELDGLVLDKHLFETAKEFYRAINAGEIKADYSKAADAGDASDVSGQPQAAEGF